MIMENAGYLFAAFAIIWTLVFGYVMVLISRQAGIKRQIEAIKETFKENKVKE